jgi:hypothetical protein
MFDENYVDRGGNPLVPNTDIPRLRPVQLGARAIGFFSDEIDNLIEALRRLRDTTPRKVPKTGDRPGRINSSMLRQASRAGRGHRNDFEGSA